MAEKELYEAALKRAMAICASREVCLSDMRQKLKVWGVEQASTEKILNTLIKDKFIDEQRFANAFVKDKFRHNKWGRIKLGAELRMKKIPDEIIKISFGSIDDGSYRETLKGLIDSHRKKVKSRNDYELKGKLVRFAQSKGFESHLVFEILEISE